MLKEHFNGLEALMEREDCKDIVLKEYEQLEISKKSRYDYASNIKEETKAEDMNRIMKDKEAMRLVRQDAREIYIAAILEMILAQDEIQAQFEPEDVRRLGDAIMEKTDMKMQSECFEFRASNSYTSIVGTDNATVKYIYMKEQHEAQEQVIMGQTGNEAGLFTSIKPPVTILPTLYTRGGNKIQCTVAKEVVVSESTCMAEVAKFKECTIVEYKKRGYNCYAYAWLSLDARNRAYRKLVNLIDTTVFTFDSAYKVYSVARKGMVVEWDAHAGVVEQASYTYRVGDRLVTEPLVSSAWGCGAVVQHPLSQVEYQGTVNFYK